MSEKERKYSKEVALFLAGISILMFFASMLFGATLAMKPEGIMVWWIGVLGTFIISIKGSSSLDEIFISLFTMNLRLSSRGFNHGMKVAYR